MTSRADRHDVDKLHRWRRDLRDSPSGGFPVYAVFLVSEADAAAHDVFRRFRSSFEERGVGFGNLVIFGQHGVSATALLLVEKLGLTPDALPLLALWAGAEFPQVSVVTLPPGEPDGAEPGAASPGLLLSRVERLAEDGSGGLDTSGIPGVSGITVSGTDLVSWVDELVESSGS